MVWLSIIVIITYSFLMLWIRNGLQKNAFTIDQQKVQTKEVFLTVLIPFRNEQHRISKLLNGLSTQSISSVHFEVLFIDDQSTDQGCSLVEEFIIANSTIKSQLIRIPPGSQSNKKKAIQLGVSQSKGEFIVQTDADAILKNTWLETIHSHLSRTEVDLLILPVFIRPNESWIGSFDSMEYSSLQALGLGMSSQNSPILCSGTNLAYCKSFYDEVSNKRTDQQLSSGDDVFLLQSAIKGGYQVSQLVNSEVTVDTNSSKSFSEFMAQRKRWVSKNTSIADPIYQGVSILGLVTNTLILFLFVLKNENALTIFIIKIVIDYLLLSVYYTSIKRNIKFSSFLVNSILYPIYLPYLLIVTYSTKNSWKGRGVIN